MKTNRMNWASIPVIVLSSLLISSFIAGDSLKPTNLSEATWIDSIAAALQSNHIFMIDGEIFIADSIPCSSSANLGLFAREHEYVYVDCTTCKSARGKAREDSRGYCTNIRKYNGLK